MLKHFKVGACRNIKLRKNYFIKTDFMTSYLRLAAKIRLHILSLECSMYQERCQKIVVGYNHFERPAKQMSYFFTILNPLLFSTDLDLKRWDFELQGSYRVLNSWKSLVILPTNFPDLEIDWKCGKKVFSFFFQSYNKCFTSEFFFFRFGHVLFNLAFFLLYVCIASQEKLCSCFFKVCVDHLEKEIIVLE